jgi:2-C-methyl-D-erythritol 4-phosphate cytidylyltransferase
VDDAPNAKRFLLITPHFSPSPLWGGSGRGYPVSVIAVPITDTCKEVINGLVRRTVARDTLVDARGPWMFDREELIRALDAASSAEVTNLVDLSRAAHLRVRVLIQS